MQSYDSAKLHWPLLLFLTFTALLAFWLALWSTPHGLGVERDSISYLDVARSVLAGNGFRLLIGNGWQAPGEAMTHFPPTYPALLALAGLLGGDPFHAARWLHALLFFCNALLIGIMTHISVGRNVWPVLCAVLLFLSCPEILRLHAVALSEPLFITFSLSALVLLSLHISAARSWALIASGLFLGLTLTTRYVGITLLPPMLLALLLFGDKSLKERIRDCFILSALGITPLVVWLLHNLLVAHTATNRQLIFHPMGLSHLKQLVHTMSDFWLPIVLPGWAKVIQLVLACGLVLSAFLIIYRSEFYPRGKSNVGLVVQTLTLLSSIIYVLFLFVSVSFADAHTPLGARILSPVYALGVILLVSLSWNVSVIKRAPWVWRISFVFWLLLIYRNADGAIPLTIRLHSEGVGYSNRLWQTSQSMAYVRALPKGLKIYTNEPEPIAFLIMKDSTLIPKKISPFTRIPNANFERELMMMCRDVSQNGAVIVYLDNVQGRRYLPEREELEAMCDISVQLRLQDGVIYSVKNEQ